MKLNPEKLIIKKKYLATNRQRITSLALWLFFGSVIAYTLYTCIVALGWERAVFLYNQATSNTLGPNTLLDITTTYFPIISVFCAAFIIWAGYNKLRFSGSRDKRQCEQLVVTPVEIAALFQLEEKTVENLQQAQTIFIAYDTNGYIAEVAYS